MRLRAPASTANLGPGFDSAAAALDLWNELQVEQSDAFEIEGEGADELPRDERHLAVRAFALFAPPAGHGFRFVNRIPLERGLGSSAAAIALGLVAGAAVAGASATLEELLEAGETLEGHGDNLAAALWGGVCLAWRREGRITATRIAAGLPLAPIVAVPAQRASTEGSRAALPASVSHADAASNAARAALLGAAIAAGDARLLGEAFHDRLHEPYRSSELLRLLRDHAPDGALGVTLSGSGPSVVVWAEPQHAARVAAELERIVPDHTKVLPLSVAAAGAGLR
jgi:homoserine kinase